MLCRAEEIRLGSVGLDEGGARKAQCRATLFCLRSSLLYILFCFIRSCRWFNVFVLQSPFHFITEHTEQMKATCVTFHDMIHIFTTRVDKTTVLAAQMIYLRFSCIVTTLAPNQFYCMINATQGNSRSRMQCT